VLKPLASRLLLTEVLARATTPLIDALVRMLIDAAD
jgi:hypothetical protein